MACDNGIPVNLHLWAPKIHLHTWQDSDQLSIALAFKYYHIIYYHKDALWSLGLAQTYFTHPDYLVVHTTYLSPDTIIQVGPQTYQYVKFFVRRLG